MKLQATMIRSMCAGVLLLATLPLAAQSLNGVRVTATLSGTIRGGDPLYPNNPSCSGLQFSMSGQATGPISGPFSAVGGSFATAGACDLISDPSAEVAMTFEIGGPVPVTGTITYSGRYAVYTFFGVDRFHQTIAPGIPAVIQIGDPPFDIVNPPATYRAVTPAGTQTGAVRFMLRAAATAPPADPATGTFEATFETTDIAFAEMAAKADLNRKRGTFEVKAVFALGDGSDGIDPLAQDVTLAIGAVEIRIPAESFRATKKSGFKFNGIVGGVAIDAQLNPLDDGAYEFKAEGGGADLRSVGTPVVVGLRVGNDVGSARVKGD